MVSTDAERDGARARHASTSSSTPSPPPHDLDPFIALLKRDGTLVLVGAPPTAAPLARRSSTLIIERRAIAGSLIGGIAETQEMLDFCAEHGSSPTSR